MKRRNFLLGLLGSVLTAPAAAKQPIRYLVIDDSPLGPFADVKNVMIDGVSLEPGCKILFTGMKDAQRNGIYIVSATRWSE